MRFHIIRNACIEYVGESQSCMVSKLRIRWKQTVATAAHHPLREALLDQLREVSRCVSRCGHVKRVWRAAACDCTGACTINRPCAQPYVGKYPSCMVISGRLIVHAPVDTLNHASPAPGHMPAPGRYSASGRPIFLQAGHTAHAVKESLYGCVWI